jgi:hypothetical protein
MKKLSILVLVLAMTSSAWATLAWFTVSPVNPSYEPSDIITIGIVADFYVGNFGLDDILTDNGGTASAPSLHELLQTGQYSDGEVMNTGNLLIQDPYGQIDGYELEDGVPPGEVVWSFQYHVPEVPESTILTISASGTIFLADAWYTEYVESIEPLEFHLPEPTTIALLGLGGLLLRRRK